MVFMLLLRLINLPREREMGFEEGKPIAKMAAERENAINAMKLEAQNTLKTNFATIDIGFLSKNQKNEVAGLNEQETAELLGSIAVSKEATGAVYLPSKAVLFRIEKQESAQSKEGDSSEMQELSKVLARSKLSLVNQNVLEYLKKKYEVKLFMRQNGENDKK